MNQKFTSKTKLHENEMLNWKSELKTLNGQLAQSELKLKDNKLKMVNLQSEHQQKIDEIKQQFASETNSSKNEMLRLKTEINSAKNQLTQVELDFNSKLEAKEFEKVKLNNENREIIDELREQLVSKANSHENEMLRLQAEIKSAKNQLTQADLDFNSKLEAKELEKVNLNNSQQNQIDELKQELASKIKSHENEMLRFESETKSFDNESNEAKSDSQLKTKKRPGQTAKKGNVCTPKRMRKEKNYDVFEVDQLLDHKMKNGKWQYLVR